MKKLLGAVRTSINAAREKAGAATSGRRRISGIPFILALVMLLGVGMGMISCCSPAVLGNLMMDIMPGMLGTEQGSTAEERDVRRAQMIQNTIS